MWDVESGQEVLTLKGHFNRLHELLWSPDGTGLVCVGTLLDSPKDVIATWDGRPCQGARALRDRGVRLTEAAFSADGQYVVTSDTLGKAHVWSLRTGEEQLEPLEAIARNKDRTTSPDGRWRAVLDGEIVRLHDLLLNEAPERSWGEARSRLDPAWQRAKAAECEKTEQWFATGFHIGQLLRAEPANSAFYLQRAFARAHVEQWTGALQDCDEAIRVAPSDWSGWHCRACLCTQLARRLRQQAPLGPSEAFACALHAAAVRLYLRQAVTDSDRALALAPREGAVWLNRSFALHLLQERDPAVVALDTALENTYLLRLPADGYVPRRGNNEALNDAARGQHELEVRASLDNDGTPAGKQAWQWALRDFPVTAGMPLPEFGGWCGRGLADAFHNRLEDAEKDFTRAAATDPKDWKAWWALARYRFAHYKFPFQDTAAVEYCTKAIALHDHFSESWYLRARLYEQLGQLDRAAQDFTRALELGADGWSIWVSRARAYNSLQQWEKAEHDYTKATTFQHGSDRPDLDALTRFGLAVSHGKRGQYDRAIAACSRALSILEDPPAYYWAERAYYHAQQKEWNLATLDFTQAAARAPAGFYYSGLYPCYLNYARGRDEAAHAICKQLLDRLGQTKDASLAHEVSWLIAVRPAAVEDYTEPVRLAQLAVAAQPGNGWYLNGLGAVLYRAGRFAEAAEQLEKGLQKKYENPQALFFLAMAHYRLGHRDQARQALEKAIQLLPREPVGQMRANGDAPIHWFIRLQQEWLRHEAEALLQQTTP